MLMFYCCVKLKFEVLISATLCFSIVVLLEGFGLLKLLCFVF